MLSHLNLILILNKRNEEAIIGMRVIDRIRPSVFTIWSDTELKRRGITIEEMVEEKKEMGVTHSHR